MNKTPKANIVYPSEYQRHWSETFKVFAESLDDLIFSSNEDNHIILTGGGTIDLTGDTLSWGEDLVFRSLMSGGIITVSAGSMTLEDGKIAYLSVARPLTGSYSGTLLVADSISVNDTSKLFVVLRVGTTLFFRDRTGLSIGSGGVSSLDEAYQGGNSVSVNDTYGEFSINGTSKSSGNVFEVIDGSSPAPFAVDSDGKSVSREHQTGTVSIVAGYAPSSDPSLGKVYVKDVSGSNELFYMDDSGNEVQITTGGSVSGSGGASDLDSAYQGGNSISVTDADGPIDVDGSGKTTGNVFDVNDGAGNSYFSVKSDGGTLSRDIQLQEVSSVSSVLNSGFVYTKDVSGTTELFYMDDSGNESQLTSGGSLNQSDIHEFPSSSIPSSSSSHGTLYGRNISEIGGVIDLYYRDSLGSVIQISKDGEINNPDILALSESSSPTTSSTEGKIYTKDASGATELFYMDNSGNEVQLTSGGSPVGGGSVGPVISLDETSAPTNESDKGKLYTKDVSGATELFYMDDSGNEVQVTSSGSVSGGGSIGPVISLDETSAPSNEADKGKIYTKDVSGSTEFFYMDDSGNEVQLTSGGSTVGGGSVGPVVSLDETSTPSNESDKGKLYTKDDDGDTELFYLDDSGNELQVTKDGLLNVAFLDWGYLSSDNIPGSHVPEAMYRFDGSSSQFEDRTDNGNDLAIVASSPKNMTFTGFAQTVGQKIDDEDDAMYLVLHNDDLDIVGALTVEMVVVIFDKSSEMFLFSHAESGESLATNVLFDLRTTTTGTFRTFNEYGSSGSNIIVDYDTSVVVGVPVYIALTRASDGVTHKLYINGTLMDTKVASHAPEKAISGNTQKLYIGQTESGALPLDGLVSSFRVTPSEYSGEEVLSVWSRIAPNSVYNPRISQFDIRNLDFGYLDSVNIPLSKVPVANYKFDGSAGQLNDLTANGNDLEIAGSGSIINNHLSAHSRTLGQNFCADANNALVTSAVSESYMLDCEMTLELILVFFSKSSASDLAVCISTGESLNTNSIWSLGLSNGKLMSFIEYGSSGNNEVINFDYSPPVGVPLYITLVRESDELTYNLYVDSTLVDTQVATNTPEKDTSGNTQLINIGANDTQTNPLDGIISSFRLTDSAFSQSDIDHVWSLVRPRVVGNISNVLSLPESTSVTSETDTGNLYTKDDDGDTELYYKDGLGNETQITKDGNLNSSDWGYLSLSNIPGTHTPEAVYNFDGSANQLDDLTANGNDLSITASSMRNVPFTFHGDTIGQSIGGNEDNGLYQTSINSGMQITGALTVEIVLMLSSLGNNMVLYTLTSNGESLDSNTLFDLRLNSFFELYSVEEYGSGSNEIMNTGLVPPVGVPIYITETRSADGLTHKFYINGRLFSTNVTTHAAEKDTSGNTQILTLGFQSTAEPIDGVISSFRVTPSEYSGEEVAIVWSNIKPR